MGSVSLIEVKKDEIMDIAANIGFYFTNKKLYKKRYLRNLLQEELGFSSQQAKDIIKLSSQFKNPNYFEKKLISTMGQIETILKINPSEDIVYLEKEMYQKIQKNAGELSKFKDMI